MAREKATFTVDRAKLEQARDLIRGKTLSETIDLALDRLIRAEQLRRDVAAYQRDPLAGDDLGVDDLPVDLDLGDADIDYEELYGDKA